MLMRNKTKTLLELSAVAKKHKSQGEKIGLITGCFDILHIGHIELFNKSKELVDVLVVGIDNDETIKKAKGAVRPINGQETRLRFLNELECVDYTFLISDTFDYLDEITASKVHKNIINTIKPHYIFTNKKTDKYWKNKEQRLSKTGTKLVGIEHDSDTYATSKILDHLLSEL